MLDTMICRHPMQGYPATSDVANAQLSRHPTTLPSRQMDRRDLDCRIEIESSKGWTWVFANLLKTGLSGR